MRLLEKLHCSQNCTFYIEMSCTFWLVSCRIYVQMSCTFWLVSCRIHSNELYIVDSTFRWAVHSGINISSNFKRSCQISASSSFVSVLAACLQALKNCIVSYCVNRISVKKEVFPTFRVLWSCFRNTSNRLCFRLSRILNPLKMTRQTYQHASHMHMATDMHNSIKYSTLLKEDMVRYLSDLC